MVVKDITEDYVQCILKGNDFDAYTAVFPVLFEHYFKYWASKQFWHQELDEASVNQRSNLVKGRLSLLEKELNIFGFDTSSVEIVLFVGQGTTNGHAFYHEDRFRVFLPVEGYETVNQVDIFVVHEILHALHYTETPEYYFSSIKEKNVLERQLITEGIATYLTSKVKSVSDEDALWGDYLSDGEKSIWMKEAKDRKSELFNYIKDIFNSDGGSLFEANDPKDILKYRVGYYLGLELIKEIKNIYAMEDCDLIKLSRNDCKIKALDILSTP